MLGFKFFSYFDSKIIRQYAIAFGFSIFGALINFYFFRQVYHNIGEESFYYYAYSRRIIAFVSPILLLGLGISLPRAIGVYNNDKIKTTRLLLLSLIVISIITTIWILFNFFCNRWLTELLWGEVNEISLRLNFIISIYLYSLNLSAIIHSYFRGKINALTSGIIELTVQSVIPLVAFILLKDLVKIYTAISFFIFLFDLIVLIFILSKKRIKLNGLIRKNELNELLSYGIRRVPGDLFYSLIIFLPAFFAGKFFSIELAGVFSFGLSLLTLFNLPSTAISFVTLSRSAQLLTFDKYRLKKETHMLLSLTVIYSFFVILFCSLFLNKLLTLFFDESFVKHSNELFNIILALPMLVVFTVNRSIIDSAFKRSYNSIFMFVALVFFMFFAILARHFHNVNFIILGNVIVYLTLSILSLLISKKIFRK